MSDQGDGRPPGRGSFDKATVDRWQVFGGMAGVVALVLSVLGGIKDLVPLSLLVSGAVTLLGVGLLYRWGRRPQRHVAKDFVVPIVLAVAGAATLGVLVGPALGYPVDPGGDTSPKSGAARDDPAERRKEHVTLNSDFRIDLDSTSAENGGVTRSDTADSDLHFNYNLFLTVDAVEVATTPSRQGCVSATALTRYIAGSKVVDGAAFCVKTTEGRWAGMTVTDVAEDGQPFLEFDLVVWEK